MAAVKKWENKDAHKRRPISRQQMCEVTTQSFIYLLHFDRAHMLLAAFTGDKQTQTNTLQVVDTLLDDVACCRLSRFTFKALPLHVRPLRVSRYSRGHCTRFFVSVLVGLSGNEGVEGDARRKKPHSLSPQPRLRFLPPLNDRAVAARVKYFPFSRSSRSSPRRMR